MTLWPGTRGWLTGVDRKHPKSLSLGAWTGSWGLGLEKRQRATKGTAQGWTCLAAGLHEALVQEKQALPGRPPSAQVGRRVAFALRTPAPASGLALPVEEEDFGSLISSYAWRAAVACGLELWPQAPWATRRRGKTTCQHREVWGDAAFTCACRGRGQRLGRDLSLAALGRLLQNACVGQLPKKGLVKNTLKPKHLRTF